MEASLLTAPEVVLDPLEASDDFLYDLTMDRVG